MRTRAERRRARLAALRLGLTLALITAVFMLVGWLDKPPEGGNENRVADTAAHVAASEEYDRVWDLYFDDWTAEQAAERIYWEVRNKWEK